MMKKTVLLLIDVQQGLDESAYGARNNPLAESRMGELLAAWRERQLPVIHIRHNSTEANSPLRPGEPGNEFKVGFEPLADEEVFQKSVNSAFIGTALEAHLQAQGITKLVVVGLTTDHCVSTSVRMAANLGFDVDLVGDATATFERQGHDGTRYTAEQMHSVNLASLNGEFCTVIATVDALAALENPAS